MPCELWFLNKAKPEAHRDQVLMIDARNIYRKVTRKIYDFSPEQEKNLLAIVWLYRGGAERFLELVADDCRRAVHEAAACFQTTNDRGEKLEPLPDFLTAIEALCLKCEVGSEKFEKENFKASKQEFEVELEHFKEEVNDFDVAIQSAPSNFTLHPSNFKSAVDGLAPLAETSRNLIKQADLLLKLGSRLAEALKNNGKDEKNNGPNNREITRALKATDEARQAAVKQLKQVRYFWKQAHWLVERFPEAQLRDVPGLVKLVTLDEIAANDWSLTPGRYVGVTPEEEDEDFDFEEAMREIHVELEDLNAEAVRLAAVIKRNFEELGI